MESLLSVRGVTLDLPTARGPLRVLDEVDLTLRRGERVALLGASGSGKSTLLRVIDGLQPLAGRGRGSVRVQGEVLQDAGGPGPRARELRAGIGVVFQQFQLAPRLDLWTNVVLGALARQPLWRRLSLRFEPSDVKRAEDALARVGLTAQASQRVSTLSGGQQQRGAIARALVQGGALVLADEPVASLDPETARRVLELLVALCEDDGRTLLVSLHQVELARRYFPRAIALRGGQVVFDGPCDALDDATLGALYGSRPHQMEVAI